MALNWDISKVKDFKTVCWIKTGEVDEDGDELVRINPITDTLIWGLLEIGVGKITEANWPEVWMRLAMADGADGEGRLYEFDSDNKRVTRSLTMEEVHAHVGLCTNISYETPAVFYKKMKEKVKRQASKLVEVEDAES